MHDDNGVRLLLGDFVEVIEEGCFVTIVGNIGGSIDDIHNYEWVSLEVNSQNLLRLSQQPCMSLRTFCKSVTQQHRPEVGRQKNR